MDLRYPLSLPGLCVCVELVQTGGVCSCVAELLEEFSKLTQSQREESSSTVCYSTGRRSR